MSALKGAVGELRMTIAITRKETGKVETYHLTGGATPEEFEAIKGELEAGTLNVEEDTHGRHP